MGLQRLLALSLIVIATVGAVVSRQSFAAESAPATVVRYTKITGTFLNYQGGQRLQTGVQYSRQELNSAEHVFVIRTYENNKVVETRATLESPDFLNFSATSDDPSIPLITGRFLSLDYEESILSASLPDKELYISGAVTKLDSSNSISIKTLTDSTSGHVIAVMQEQIELISEAEFKSATNIK